MLPRGRALFLRLYAAVLRMYPAEHRQAFGEEMLWTVEQRLESAEWQPAWARASLALFELQGLLGGALREQVLRFAPGKERAAMSMNPVTANPAGGELPGGTRAAPGSAWRAAWPHLLFGTLILIVSTFELLPPGVPENLSGILGAIAGVIVVGVLLVGFVRAWRSGWRAGDASLGGYVLVLVVLASILLAQLPPPPLRWCLMSLSLVSGAALIGMLALLSISRKAPLNAVLAAVPLVLIFWLPTQEFTIQPARMLAYFSAFLLAGLAAAWMVRFRRAEYAAVVGMGLSLAAGIAITYARAYYHTDYPGASSELPLNVMLYYLFPQAAALGVFFCLPPVLSFLVGGVKGNFSAGGWLAALGMLGQYLGYSLSFFWHMEMDSSWVHAAGQPDSAGMFFTVVVYVSLGVYACGLWLLARQAGRAEDGLWWAAAALLPSMLVTAAAALFYGMIWNPQALPVWMDWMPLVNEVQRAGIALGWMAVTAGVLAGVGRRGTLT